MAFIYFILFILAFFVLAAIGLISGVFRLLFGSKQNTTNSSHRSRTGNTQNGSTHWYTYNRKKKKIFSDTEGEYVEFEEIKDENKSE